MAASNNIVHEKYITISAEKKNIREARTYFARVGSDLTADFAKISSQITELGYKERLRLLYEFFRGNEAGEFTFDLKGAMAKGAHFKDYISPDSIEFKKDYIQIGDRYARVLFLKEYPSFLKDDLLSQLTDFSRSMMVSIDIQPIPTDEAVKEIQKKLLAIETDITKWQQKQNMNNNFSATVPYEMEQMQSEIKEFMDDLTLSVCRVVICATIYRNNFNKHASYGNILLCRNQYACSVIRCNCFALRQLHGNIACFLIYADNAAGNISVIIINCYTI